MKEYLEKGEYAPREGVPYTERKNVALILVYENQFGLLKWNNVHYKSLVTGGIEDGEEQEESVLRELEEETGYYDVQKVLPVLGGIHAAKFYVEHKKQNRAAIYYPYVVVLSSLKKKEILEAEKEEHSLVWLTKQEVYTFGMFENHMFMFEEGMKVLENDC